MPHYYIYCVTCGWKLRFFTIIIYRYSALEPETAGADFFAGAGDGWSGLVCWSRSR